jgi:hypothetical protein
MANKRIIDLNNSTTVSDSDYFATDNSTTGTHKLAAKVILDKIAAKGGALNYDTSTSMLQLLDEAGGSVLSQVEIQGGGGGGTTYTISVTTTESTLYGQTVTATYGASSKTATFSGSGAATISITDYTGDVTLSATDGTKTATTTVTIVSGTTSYSASLAFSQIYGISWDGSSSSAWTRTDAAALFADPTPAVSNGNGSSPFDNILPWSGMEKVTDASAGVLVKIPKYYYKWTKSGAAMTLQISSESFSGSHVSPAHANRGDGHGERDYVYVGRYHCSTSDYKSTTGVLPKVSVTRDAARTAIKALGTGVYQYDFAMYWTIMMLYLVEYADWNSQAKIGYGCAPTGSTSAVRNVGYTDAMVYHTGTDQASRTTYGGTQYRYIEGLWDNCFDWVDGIYFSGADVLIIDNPANFSDSTGGTKVGERATTSNDIKSFFVPSVSGLEWALYPNDVVADSNYETYVCDHCSYYASGVVLRAGGFYNQSQYHGAFYLVGYYQASSSDANVGARLQKLPN